MNYTVCGNDIIIKNMILNLMTLLTAVRHSDGLKQITDIKDIFSTHILNLRIEMIQLFLKIHQKRILMISGRIILISVLITLISKNFFPMMKLLKKPVNLQAEYVF